MANARALDKRRKSIRNIRKITRTMELIATARYKKAMDRASAATAYTDQITRIVSRLAAAGLDVAHPLLEQRDNVESARVLVLSSNRGLCGGYNGSILRTAAPRINELQESIPSVAVDVSGKRGINGLKFRGIDTDEHHTQFEDQPAYDEVEKIANSYLSRYITGQIDRLDVVYTKFISTSKQIATIETLLPLGSLGGDETEQESSNAEYEFPAFGCKHPGGGCADQLQGSLVQVLSGCRRQRTGGSNDRHERRDRERRRNDQTAFDDLQPRPSKSDHRRDHGDHRRGRGLGELRLKPLPGTDLESIQTRRDLSFPH